MTSDAEVDTSFEIITKDLEEKEVVEEAENGRCTPAKGTLMREMGSRRLTTR